MADGAFDIEIQGMEQLLRRLDGRKLLGPPLRRMFDRSGLEVVARARQKAPVFTGRLHTSIRHQVDRANPPQWATIGTNLEYAPPVEFGSRPHWPPPGALQPWAQRHGFPAGERGDYIVRRAISRRGTKAKPFLYPALAESMSRIKAYISIAAKEIEVLWRTN